MTAWGSSASCALPEYASENFPNPVEWTIDSSISEGFQKKDLPLNAWGDANTPFYNGFDINSNTLIFADQNTHFYPYDKEEFFIYINPKIETKLTFNLGNSTLRGIDETEEGLESFISIREANQGLITIEGDENSSLQFKGKTDDGIYVTGNSSVNVETGDIWLQIQTPSDSGYSVDHIQIFGGSSLKMDATKDLIIIADLREKGEIASLISNRGTLQLSAKRMYFGMMGTDATADGIDTNVVFDLSGGNVILGSDNTELIALNGGHVGLAALSNLDSLSLKTKKLQIIGDKFAGSNAIYIQSENKELFDFQANEAYLANVETGIINNNGAARLQFDRLWDLGSRRSLAVLYGGELELDVNDFAYFENYAEVYSGGSLILNDGNFYFGTIVWLHEDCKLNGSAKSLTALYLDVENRSLVDLPSADLYLGSNSSSVPFAVMANTDSVINLNSQKSTERVVHIDNHIVAANGAQINANFLNANSHFIGTVLNSPEGSHTEASGKVNLEFANGAYWRVTDSSTQDVNLMLNKGVIYLDQTPTGETLSLTEGNAKTLTLSNLDGEGGIFYMRTSLQEAYGDSIHINNGSGNHQLMLASSGQEPTDAALNRALVTEIQGSLELSLANEGGKVDLGNYVYDLANRKTESGTEWYLKGISTDPEGPYEPGTDPEEPDNPGTDPDPDPGADPEEPDNPGTDPDPDPGTDPEEPDNPGTDPDPDPGDPELSPSATAVLALAGTGSQTTQFLYSLSDLRKRMGEVRYGVSDGLYASVRGGKDKIHGFASTSYKNEYGALSIGFDRRINNNLIAGFSFEAIKGEQDVKNNGYHAEGENTTQSLKAYATWFNDSGYYVDFVAAINHFDQDIRTHMLDGKRIKGDYDSYGYGISTEFGKTIYWGTDNSFFIEPQMQLSYFRVQGKDFSMSNGMRVEQDNADSLTGRLGLVLGHTVLNRHGTGYQISLRGGVNHEFLGDADIRVNNETFSDDSLGTRGYYGIGFDWYPSQKIKVYGHIEREKGSYYTSEINAKIGAKFQF